MADPQFESAWRQFGGFRLDLVTYTVVVADGRMVKLTAFEFRVFYDLVSHAGRFRTSQDIYQMVWGARTTKENGANVIAVYVRRLRRKIEPDPTHPVHIMTARRKGYLFQP